MNKAFIFDWSGTLSDNFHCFCKVCDQIFKELGKEPISEKEIRLNFTLPYMKFWNRYFPKLSKERENKLYDKYIHQAGEPDLYKGVDKIIKSLHSKGYKLFVLSSDPISKLMPEIKRSGLSECFEEVIGNVHEKGQAIKEIMTQHNLDLNLTYYIGDTSGDIEAGKQAKVKTIGISWGFQDKSVLARSKPDFLIDDIVEIKEILVNN